MTKALDYYQQVSSDIEIAQTHFFIASSLSLESASFSRLSKQGNELENSQQALVEAVSQEKDLYVKTVKQKLNASSALVGSLTTFLVLAKPSKSSAVMSPNSAPTIIFTLTKFVAVVVQS